MEIDLDVQDVKFVINFDFPSTSEDYIHRIGRTGRNKNSGTSYAFFTRENVKQLDSLIAILREADQNICPQLLELAERNSNSNRGGNYRKRRYDQGESGNGGNYYESDYANKKPRNNWNGSSGQIVPGNAMERRSRWDSNASGSQSRYAAQTVTTPEDASTNGRYAANYQQSAAPQSYSGSAAIAATTGTSASGSSSYYGSSGGTRPPYSSYQHHAPPPPLPSAYTAAAVTYEKRY